MTVYLSRLRLFNRNVYLFLLTAFLVGFAFDGGIYSVIFNLFLLRLGYDPASVGQVNSAGLLAFALFSIPAGLLGRRWGSRPMMIIGLSLMFTGCGLVPLVEFSPFTWQTGWLFVTYILIFLGLALYFVNAAPFMMHIADPAVRNHIFSMQIALLSLAAFAGSLVGGLLPGLFAGEGLYAANQAAPYRYPLLFAACLLMPAIWAMASTQETHVAEAVGEAEEDTSIGNQGAVKIGAIPFVLLAVLVLVRFFQVAGVASTFIFFNVYLDAGLQVPTAQIGTLAAFGRVLAVPAALLTPLLAARYGNERLVVWASLGSALCMLPLALIPHWSAAGLGFMGMAALSSIRFPAFLVYSMEVVSPKQRGLVAGVGEMAAGLSFAGMALSGGYIITAFGYQPLFLMGAGLTVIGAFAFGAYFRKPDRELEPQVLVETKTV